MSKVRLTSLFLTFYILISGCSNISYYTHTIDGHWKLMSKRQQIDALLVSDDINEQLKAQLRLATKIRAFSVSDLHLPNNGSYKTYVDTGQEFVTWAVIAAPEFSLTPIEWCFLFAGCVQYRGYFSQQKARDFAHRLKEQGMEVVINGVIAYSTLGWFDDPLLNTMVQSEEAYLAGLMFHELAHQRLYLRNDTPFNEAFAITVEEAGVRKWLADRPEALERYELYRLRLRGFFSLIKHTRKKLVDLYDRNTDEETMRADKKILIAELTKNYEQQKQRWNGYSGFDEWFAQPINNATLASVAMYYELVPQFRRLLKLCNGDFVKFYKTVTTLRNTPVERRRQQLRELTACTAS